MTGAHPEPRLRADLALANEPEAIRRAQEEVLAATQQQAYPEAACFAIRLALEEAVYNAFRHGHRDLPDEPVRLSWAITPDDITITIEDRGPGFVPEDVPDPTSDDRLEIPHGRGLMLMRAYMTSVEFNSKGNRVSMLYRRST